MGFTPTNENYDRYEEAVEKAKSKDTIEMIKFLAAFGPPEYRMTERELSDFLNEIQEINPILV
jgi:hypothetical protein